MKRTVQSVMLCLFAIGSFNAAKAQSTLIHYWHFNNMAGVFHNPGIPTIKADFSAIDTNKTGVAYNNIGSSTYAGYLDEVATVSTDYDTANLRMSAAAGNAYRFRNPSDSAYLTFFIPSNGYKNLVLKFATESSNPTTAPNYQTYAYSTDSGATWKTSGLNIAADSMYQTFTLHTITFGSDTTVNNNKKLVFKVTNTNRTTGGGNCRFDNISLDGNPISVSVTPSLIHYWHFNNFTAAYHNPGIPSLKADWSAIDTNKTACAYKLLPGTSSTYAGYIDGYSVVTADSDVFNLRTINSVLTPAGSCYRMRNPTDSAYLVFYIPSTGYKNLVFSYTVEASSVGNGYHQNAFQYSTDSGATWKTTGLDHIADTAISIDTTPQCIFKPITVSFTTADTTVNNNPKLCFKITPAGIGTNHTSGNNRFDNVTLDGVAIGGTSSVPQVTAPLACKLYPNPAKNYFTLDVPVDGEKIISIYNTAGQRVYTGIANDKQIIVNTSQLSNGLYIVNVMAGTQYTSIRFIKN